MSRVAPAYGPVPVAVVGAGPVGLSLALGLARHGVRSVVLEREDGPSERSKAPAIHVRTREVFRQWGVERSFLDEGVLLRRLTVHSAVPGRRPLYAIDFSELEGEADRPGLLVLEQGRTERILLEAARATGLADVRFATEAVGLSQSAHGATLRVRGDGGREEEVEAELVVGCDGASSFVREALGLPFEGDTYALSPVLADVRVEDARDRLPWPRAWNGRGAFAFGLRLEPGLWRLVVMQHGAPSGSREVREDELRTVWSRVLGPGPAEVVWANRFRIHLRASPRFRAGRVLLAGDAAHVHSPVFGFGMNGGIQDAHNLAWKLAAVLGGGDADRLLDSYDAERRAVIVETVSRYADLLTRVFLGTPPALRDGAILLFRQALRSRRFRLRVLRRSAMLDLDYPPSPLLEEGDRGAGVRLPNPRLLAPDGTAVRLHHLLPTGPALLAVGELPDGNGDASVARVLRIGPGGYRDPSGLIQGLLEEEDGWILVRPDLHVAWARKRLDAPEDLVRRALGGVEPAAVVR